ncbi:hypothetical protein FSPOR_556 [Fusarium sporotrichioides]|uniref:Uncharacterized protein n=1 Tax=Fusarium sporotrichioides TaxID=5514 RepID=A0A395STG3_FUSSP|nr:hypothetical protein FSPOR_556 [Fusarium sporotrichioides]
MTDSNSSSSIASSASESTQNWPLNKDNDDTLIPSLADVHCTFFDGKATWETFLDKANKIPLGLWPAEALNPYTTLAKVPSLPERLPRRCVLYGRLCWELPLAIGGTSFGEGDTDRVRLFEVQGRRVQYSMDRLWPNTPECQNGHVIDLEGASPSLIRWLCAILSPNIGWKVMDKGGLTLWATCFATEVKICIEAPASAIEIRSAPNSAQATSLLIELCRLFNLGADRTGIASDLEPMQPYQASFLTTLMLPFYKFMGLVPCLPPPHLTRQRDSTFESSHEQSIQGYLDDMRYFMTLSLSPISIGSMLWSILWQPDIDCNLKKQVEVLVKVFLSRRPRIAIWWVALFMLGDLGALDWIRRYTVTIEERYGFGSLSPPDPMVSAWTGCKQSFLDIEKESIYANLDDLVSKADLLRCRFDQRLQDTAGLNLSWRPFGYIQKKQVELELWPQLETKYYRKYHSFTWYVDKNQPISDKGFRVCTGRTVDDVPDNLEMVTSPVDCLKRNDQALNIEPSKKSTLRMMDFLVENAIGDRDWANADVQVPEQFRWLRDFRGLEFSDSPLEDVEKLAKAPSWFLEEWIRDKYQ